jgi:hypothetical protein
MISWTKIHTCRFYRFAFTITNQSGTHSLFVMWKVTPPGEQENFWVLNAETQKLFKWPDTSSEDTIMQYVRNFMANKGKAQAEHASLAFNNPNWTVVNNGFVSLTRFVYGTERSENYRVRIYVQYAKMPRLFFATTNEDPGDMIPEERMESVRTLFDLSRNTVAAEFAQQMSTRSQRGNAGYSMNIGVEPASSDGLRGGV